MASPKRGLTSSTKPTINTPENGTGQAAFPTEGWLCRNGTSRVPYGRMALPERDKPRSLRKDGFAGTGQAAFPTEGWQSHIPYDKVELLAINQSPEFHNLAS